MVTGSRRRTWMAALAVTGLLAAGCAGGGHRSPPAAQAAASLPPLTFESRSPAADVTAQAKQASSVLVTMAGTIRSWELDCSVADPLIQQLGYADDALQQGNRVGARVLLTAWTIHAQAMTRAGVLTSADGAQYQALASRAENQLPGEGRVFPFRQAGAPSVAEGTRTCPGIAGNTGTNAFFDNLHIFVPIALRQIPHVGFLLSGLYSIIFKEHDATRSWEAIRTQVEAVVKKQIQQHVKDELNGKLRELQSFLQSYVVAVNNGFPEEDVKSYWVHAQEHLNAIERAGYFKPAQDGYLFLPEFSEFMNLDLASLREGILAGPDFGLSPGAIDLYKRDFTKSPGIIADATAYVNKWYDPGRTATPFVCQVWVKYENPSGGAASKKCRNRNIDEFNSKNAYDIFMIQAAKDQEFNWPYFNPVQYPGKADVPRNTRVIFSNAYGSGASAWEIGGASVPAGPISPAQPPNADPLSLIKGWTICKKSPCPAQAADLWVKAWQLQWGGNVLTNPPVPPSRTSPLFGYSGGTLQPPVIIDPVSYSESVKSLLITSAFGAAGSDSGNPIINWIRFTRANGQQTPASGPIGGTQKENYSARFPSEQLADMYSGGNAGKTSTAGTDWKSPSSVVFGFRYEF